MQKRAEAGRGSLVDDAGGAVDVVAVLGSIIRAPGLHHAQAVLEVWQADVDHEEVCLGGHIPTAMPQECHARIGVTLPGCRGR